LFLPRYFKPRDSRHNIAVGLVTPLSIRIEGPVGYYCAGLCDGVDVHISGGAGWGLAENLMGGRVVLEGSAGSSAGAMMRGKIVSARNPRKWPQMFSVRASFEGHINGTMPPVRITLPDGSSILSNQSDLNSQLSRALGREVSFESTPPEAPELEEYWPDVEGLPYNDHVTDEGTHVTDEGTHVTDEGTLANTFFELSTIHILAASTIDALRELYPQGRFEVRRFRPNIVVETQEKGFVENAWIGKTLQIGEVMFEVTGPCPRCVMTTVPQYDLPKDSGILRGAVQHNEGGVGIYAKVLQSGTIKRGDKATIVE